MLIAAVLCLCAAVATAAVGLWSLRRPSADGPVPTVLRSIAPIQLASAVILAAGGAGALAAPGNAGVTVLVVCVLGAVSTLAAGCYQGAKAGASMLARENAAAGEGCGGSCASCTLSCN